LLQETLSHSESGTSADVLVEINPLGLGHAEFSNIVLGSVNVPLFGSRPIQRINIEASVLITGFDYGDFNRDAKVDSADYVLWRKTLFQTGSNLPADGDNSGMVDLLDYGIWRENFGRQSSASSASAAVPEPTTSFVSILLLLGASLRRRQR
jgi:hypothetical protein